MFSARPSGDHKKILVLGKHFEHFSRLRDKAQPFIWQEIKADLYYSCQTMADGSSPKAY